MHAGLTASEDVALMSNGMVAHTVPSAQLMSDEQLQHQFLGIATH
jgi:ABC-type branched-subunit amino acid transport system ATPase component